MASPPSRPTPLGPQGRRLGGALLLLLALGASLLPALADRLGHPSALPSGPASAGPAAAPRPVLPAALTSVSTYREAIVGLPASLNPLLAAADPEWDVARLLFAGLTRTDGRGGVEPDLAERWTISDDGRVYTFTMRANAIWHDGQPVTSRDVLFTVRLLQDPAFPGGRAAGGLWRTVQVHAPSPALVRFTLSEPYAPFLSRTAFPLLPAHRLHGVYPGDLAGHAFGQQPIGAGPYRTAEGLREGDLLLERFERYHGPRPGIDRLLLRFYPDGDEALAALRGGAVDGLAGVPAGRLAELRAVPGLRLHDAPLNGYTALLFNLRRPLFQSREVRQALALAVDRAALVEAALAGAGEPATGPIVPTNWAHRSPVAAGGVHEARALLDRAGWVARPGDGVRERDGRALSFTLLTTDSPERRRAAAALAAQLAAAGVGVTVTEVPPGELLARYLLPHDFDAALFGWSALGDDPDPYSLWHSSQADGGYNIAGWSLPRADELLEAARQARDQGERVARYADFQRLFADEVPSIILYCPRYVLVTAERVRVELGPINRPADRFRAIDRWSVEPLEAVG